MISEVEALQLKKILGTSFISDVQEFLLKKNIKNKKGEPFSKGFISHVFNGRNENEAIENAIWKIAEKRKAEKEKYSKKNIKIKETVLS